ncbi:MAG: polysaccharide pyruvyl transferase family protein [Candidatus Cloacimonetes bacterium]|nr:polysaccharide pyruvyl transferase family protein [Candidatus Cloacimonadota bacterium]
MKMILIMKKYIPNSVWSILAANYTQMIYRKDTCMLKKTANKKRLILLGSPEHGNLGDHAIASAEIKYLRATYPNIPIIDLTGPYVRKCKSIIQSNTNANDILIITGGGFLGSLWMTEESMVREILSTFPKNKIIIFPQTIYFDDTNFGHKELQKSLKYYQNHPNLHICLRDQASFEFVKQNFIGGSFHHAYLIPDMALYLNKSSFDSKRQGILLCLREDKESCLSSMDKKQIQNIAVTCDEKVIFTTTVLAKNVTKSMRERELSKKFSEFSHVKLVITDRLHGMLFAAVTGTPCIAFNNLSKKVGGVYQWISSLHYVKILNNADNLSSEIYDLLKYESCLYDPTFLYVDFAKLADIINED